MRLVEALVLSVLLVFSASCAIAEPNSLQYEFAFLPKQQAVDVDISVAGRSWLRRAEFDLDGYDISAIKHNGELERSGERLTWIPPQGDAFLRYRVAASHQRSSGSYDAFVGNDWALLRGEDLIPPVRIRKLKGAHVEVTMRFVLPKDWSSVNTGWQRVDENSFRIVNPKQTFPRPAGWIVAGNLGTRHETVGETQFSISAPRGHDFRQMELLSFIGMTWPLLAQALDVKPEKILITGAGKPMWRGGLSGPNSFFVHSDRPLVSENGTSTIIHELVHVAGAIDAHANHDWIVEGLAEFYSVEILYRAGGYSRDRRQTIFEGLADWSSDVKTLLGKQSQGEVTARAAVMFDQLHHELQGATEQKHGLDHLVRRISGEQDLTVANLRSAYRELTGEESDTLRSSLLKSAKQ